MWAFTILDSFDDFELFLSFVPSFVKFGALMLTDFFLEVDSEDLLWDLEDLLSELDDLLWDFEDLLSFEPLSLVGFLAFLASFDGSLTVDAIFYYSLNCLPSF